MGAHINKELSERILQIGVEILQQLEHFVADLLIKQKPAAKAKPSEGFWSEMRRIPIDVNHVTFDRSAIQSERV